MIRCPKGAAAGGARPAATRRCLALAVAAALAVCAGEAQAAPGAAAGGVGGGASGRGAAKAREGAVTLSIDQARELARRAFLAGDFRLAEQLADGLLQRDPNDSGALLTRAASETRLGRPAAGLRTARRAWRVAGDARLRYAAARLAAQAAASEKHYELSKFWLRRSLSQAGTPAQRAESIRDFKVMRIRSPWEIRLDASVMPTSNVNGGASGGLLTVTGLPFVGVLTGPAQALSGTQEVANLGFSYRIAATPRYQTQLGGRVYLNANQLSHDARRLAPDASGSDFDFDQVEAFAKQTFLIGRSADVNSAQIAAGRSWYGGDPYDHTLRLDLARSHAFSAADGLRASVSLQQQWLEEAQPTHAVSVALDWSHLTAWGDSLDLAGGLSRVNSDEANLAYYGGWMRLSYAFGKPLGPMHLSASLTASRNRYGEYTVLFPVPGGRVDKTYTAAVNVALDKPSTLGFAPVVSLTYQRSLSNVSRFDTRNLGIGIGIRSRF